MLAILLSDHWTLIAPVGSTRIAWNYPNSNPLLEFISSHSAIPDSRSGHVRAWRQMLTWHLRGRASKASAYLTMFVLTRVLTPCYHVLPQAVARLQDQPMRLIGVDMQDTSLTLMDSCGRSCTTPSSSRPNG